MANKFCNNLLGICSIFNSTKWLCLLIFAILVSGCGTITERHFPQLHKNTGTPTSIDIVVDTFIVTDISGRDLGVDLKKNKRTLDIAIPFIKKLLTGKGYRIGREYGNTGLIFEPDTGDSPRAYYYTDGWNATGKLFTPTIEPIDHDFWPSVRGRSFLKTFNQVGMQARAASKRLQIDAVSQLQHPVPIDSQPSELLMFISINGKDVHPVKSFVSSVAIGTLSAVTSSAITGGNLILVGFPQYSHTGVSIAVYDKQKKKLIWYVNDIVSPGYARVSATLRTAFTLFPDIYGVVEENNDFDEDNF